jgi:hypothetical protein
MAEALLRIVRILIAYALASLAAGYAVYISLLVMPSAGMGHDASASGISFGLMVTMFVALFAALPAAIVISWGEFRAWRMWWYYAIAGSVIGAVLGKMFIPPHWFVWLGLGFGPVSGLIYWAVAGRTAGPQSPSTRNGLTIVFLGIAVILLFGVGPAYLGLLF